MNVIDFNMIVHINNLLKENNINASVHGIGGCASCGLEVRSDDGNVDYDLIISIINNYISYKLIRVINYEHDPSILYTESLV